MAGEALQAGGGLYVIIPCRQYENTFSSTSDLRLYRRLFKHAATREILDYEKPSEEAFWDAGKRSVDKADVLLAIWDGAPSRGLGGTADVVMYTRQRGRTVSVIRPNGVQR